MLLVLFKKSPFLTFLPICFRFYAIILFEQTSDGSQSSIKRSENFVVNIIAIIILVSYSSCNSQFSVHTIIEIDIRIMTIVGQLYLYRET